MSRYALTLRHIANEVRPYLEDAAKREEKIMADALKRKAHYEKEYNKVDQQYKLSYRGLLDVTEKEYKEAQREVKRIAELYKGLERIETLIYTGKIDNPVLLSAEELKNG